MINKLIAELNRRIGAYPKDNVFNTWYYGKTGMAYDYCAVFILYVFHFIGITELLWDNYTEAKKAVAEGVKNWMARAKHLGQWFTENYQVGDVVIFDFNKNGIPDHIGVIIAITSATEFETIEGNTTMGNLSGVFMKKRNIIDTMGVFRPLYDVDNSSSPNTPLIVKGNRVKIINAVDYKGITLHPWVKEAELTVVDDPLTVMVPKTTVCISPNGKAPVTARVEIENLEVIK